MDDVTWLMMYFVFHKWNYFTVINGKISLHSSLPVVPRVLNRPAVKEAGYSVFVLAQFLNNRKSLVEAGRMEDLLPVNMVNVCEIGAAGAKGARRTEGIQLHLWQPVLVLPQVTVSMQRSSGTLGYSLRSVWRYGAPSAPPSSLCGYHSLHVCWSQ